MTERPPSCRAHKSAALVGSRGRSAARSWEIAVKYALGRLKLPEPPSRYVPARIARQGMTPLPVAHSHALRVSELPRHHRDPFDRLLVAQAQLERATVVTADPSFVPYEVDILWAAVGEPPSLVSEVAARSRRRHPSASRRRRVGPTARSIHPK